MIILETICPKRLFSSIPLPVSRSWLKSWRFLSGHLHSNKHSYGKRPIHKWFTYWKWSFSMAILAYPRAIFSSDMADCQRVRRFVRAVHHTYLRNRPTLGTMEIRNRDKQIVCVCLKTWNAPRFQPVFCIFSCDVPSILQQDDSVRSQGSWSREVNGVAAIHTEIIKKAEGVVLWGAMICARP